MEEKRELEEKKTPRSLSRRKFLRDAGIVVGGTAVGSAFLFSACGGDEEVTKTVTTTVSGGTVTVTSPPGTTPPPVTITKPPVSAADLETVSFTVNGFGYETTWDSRTTMYDALHQLGWIGPKQFCDRGACGSCTVLIDNRPVLSCMTLACECDGKTIETSEGIADSEHPLTQAYIDNDCMQCGYCTPGFFVTAKALLDKNPNPSRDEIIEALAANLCRCGTYPQHILAVQQAANNL